MKKNKKMLWLLLSGIWIAPLLIPVAGFYASYLSEPNIAWQRRFRIFGYTLKDWLIMLCIVAIPVLAIFLVNLWKYFILKQRDFFPLKLFKTDEDVMDISDDKRIAQQHPVPEAYLSDKPDGLTVGEYREWLQKRYVRFPFFEDPEHQYLHGLPGSRKSSLLISSLLWNYNFAPPEQRFKSALVVDAKPELALKSVDICRPDIIILNPSEFGGWGFDVWHGLNQDNTDDEIKKRAGMMAKALIPDLSDDNKHFSGNAQNILIGFIMHGFRKGKGFAETIIDVLHLSTSDLIAEVLADPEMREEHQKIIGKVKEFDGSVGEGYESIRHTLKENLGIFDTDSVKYCFDDNPKKVSPQELINGKSIFLCIPDADMNEYRTVFGMIMELCCKHLMRQFEEDVEGEPPIWVLCDEAGTIYVPSLLDTIARGRSRHIQVTVITQDEEMMERTYGKSEARSIRNNCKTKIYLSCGDVETAKDLVVRTGEYKETKISSHMDSLYLRGGKQNISYEYRPVMNVADISMLEAKNQVLVFAKEGWCLCDKLTYKDIPLLKEKSEQLYRKNTGKGLPRELSYVPVEEDELDVARLFNWNTMRDDMRQSLAEKGIFPHQNHQR